MTEPSEAPADVERAARAAWAAKFKDAGPEHCEECFVVGYDFGFDFGFAASAAERERLERKAGDANLLLRAMCLGVVDFAGTASEGSSVPELSPEMRARVQAECAKAQRERAALSSGLGDGMENG